MDPRKFLEIQVQHSIIHIHLSPKVPKYEGLRAQTTDYLGSWNSAGTCSKDHVVSYLDTT